MAKLLLSLAVIAAVITTLFSVLASASHGFLQSQKPAPRAAARQKLSHFKFYWHDVASGPHPSDVPVAGAPSTNTSKTAEGLAFGVVNVIDDALTEGPDMSSKLVGRAQGFFASASQEYVGLIMAMNFAFMEGKYNGSSITILGRNRIFSEVREMPVVGGSGLFRLAQGYALAHTHSLDMKTGDAVVEYNVFVLHY